MAATWKQIREGLALSEEEERVIELEKKSDKDSGTNPGGKRTYPGSIG